MNIQVSKAFAKHIESIKNDLRIESAEVVKVSEQQYRWYICTDTYQAERYGDYDPRTGKFKAIMIEYPADYCSSPRYLTTAELTKEFRVRNVKTMEELNKMLKDMIEI